MLLIRSHATKIEMQAFLSNYEEYKSGKKFSNSIKNKVMQKVSIDIHNYTKAIEILKRSKCDKDVIWHLSVFFLPLKDSKTSPKC